MSDFIISLGQAINQVDLTTPSWDVFVLLFFLIGVFIYGIALGRNRVIILLLSLYFSLAIYQTSSLVKNIGNTFFHNNDLSQILTFAILFLLTFLIVGQSGAAQTLATNSVGSFGQTIIFAILQVGLTLSIAFNFLPTSMQERFSPIIHQIFIEPIGQLIWLTLPILALIITRVRRNSLN